MKKILCLAMLTCVMSGPASAQYVRHHGEIAATAGNCMVAIEEAQENGNEWNAPFPMDDCKRVAAAMIDDGYKMMKKGLNDPDTGSDSEGR